MSTINLKGDTSGQVAVVVPAVAGSNTFTIPAETGTARTTVSTGTVLQVVNYQTGAVATGTTVMPLDDTIPQNTEGNEYMTLAITPRSATSKLIVGVVVGYGFNAAAGIGIALFQDSTANALLAVSNTTVGVNSPTQSSLSYSMVSGTTSSTTFKVRIGGGSAGTLTFNGVSGGRFFAGLSGSTITITEVVP